MDCDCPRNRTAPWLRLLLSISLMCSLGVALTIPVRAQSDTAREFKQQQEERDKALAAAAAPINQRYAAVLEQLLKRATQANDLDTAVKIRAELQKLGVTSPTTGATAGAAGSDEAKRAALRAKLRDSKWKMNDGKTFALNADGTTNSSWHGKHFTWKVTGPGQAEIAVSNSGSLRLTTFNDDVTTGTMGNETIKRLAP